ncbi:MAG: ATP-binding cassette domain-containing protein, partial [Angustibacter sp.]
MLTIKNATKEFGSRTLWKNISMEIPQGKVLGLVGASGSGKSTLLNCLGLLEDLSRGEIHLGEQRITGINAGKTRKFRRDHLGYLFQNYALVENASITQNLDIAKPQFRRSAETRNRQAAALATVGLAGRGKEP